MLYFKKIVIHNFGSYEHEEIDLTHKGFCLVQGKNLYKNDDSESNGSGKSTFINAIFACITGETPNGLHSGFKNKLIDEDLCYITLDFKYDKDEYEITRHFNPRSALKIIKNEVNISGKTLTDSKKILSDNLPILTKELLSSIVILGQGMPNRLTYNSPSGRKELLEKLTRTDFMIDDVKERINIRLNLVNSKIRELEDSILVKTTNLKQLKNDRTTIETELSLEKKPNEDDLTNLNTKITEQNNDIKLIESKLQENDKELEDVRQKLLDVHTKQSNLSEELQNQFQAKISPLNETKISLETQIKSINHEISHIKSIVDVCPTCHRKLDGISKPSTEELDTKLIKLNEELKSNADSISEFNQKFQKYSDEIKQNFSNDILNLTKSKTDLESNHKQFETTLKEINGLIRSYELQRNSLLKDLENFDNLHKKREEKLLKISDEIKELEKDIDSKTNSKIDYEQRLAILKKMDYLAKRDFRGLLLQNIISFLDKKAKEFGNIIFNTTSLDIKLDENNLDIYYDNKIVESLSGGERTKVDLIIQLTLRNLLLNYFGISSNILALDEVTDFLDGKGCKKIFDLIQSELNTVESVFIISHHSLELDLMIDSQMTVVKNADGISHIN